MKSKHSCVAGDYEGISCAVHRGEFLDCSIIVDEMREALALADALAAAVEKWDGCFGAVRALSAGDESRQLTRAIFAAARAYQAARKATRCRGSAR